jgi:predicted ATPase
VPTVHGVRRLAVGSMETLEFQQQLAAQDSWRFAARSMSDGTLRALGVLTALFQSNADFSPSLIAIEEPEAALHPEAGAALREALERASKEVQIIITSHSPELLDDVSVEHHQLLAVTAMSGETQLASIDSASRDAIQGKSFSAGELLKKGQLIPDAESLRFQALHQISLFGGEVD